MNQLNIKQLPELPFDVAESINQLRVNLSFCGKDIKTIMITSSTPNEGKSFISMNLWRQMAEMGGRVLIIDCDLRNSEMRTKYGVFSDEHICGIEHYLSGKVEISDVIYETNIPGGSMIPMTTYIANPSILLEGERFQEMLQYCRGQFDTIIIDTPPLVNVADSMNIAKYCDGSVLVIRSGITSRKLVNNTVHMLKKTGTPLLGMVLNRIDTKRKAYQYYYKKYYKRYGYYGKTK